MDGSSEFMMVQCRQGPAPAAEIERARLYARRIGRSVFLFHDGQSWRLEANIRAVPMTGGTVEIPPDQTALDERMNRGGC